MNKHLPTGEKPHHVWAISMLDWSVDAYGDSCQPADAQVLGHNPINAFNGTPFIWA